MQTASGAKYWPLDPRPGDVNIFDISSALSRLCRYGGHANRHYSVAEHSVRMCWMLKKAGFIPHVQFQALMHDATEAYLCDIPRPVKPLILNYKAIEELNWFAISDRFGLPLELHEVVSALDQAIPQLEMEYVMPHTNITVFSPYMAGSMHFVGWPAWLARRMFMREFKRLYKEAR